jgi:3-methyladenine DNA glycosylase AlkD
MNVHSTAQNVKAALAQYASSKKAKASAWFFKTAHGQYGEGDRFVGVTVPEQRIVAKQFRDLSFAELDKLLASPIHEHRLTALLILVAQYEHEARMYVHEQQSNLLVDTTTATKKISPKRSSLKRHLVNGRPLNVVLKIVRYYLDHLDRINNWDLVDLSAPRILGMYYRTYGGENKLYVLARSKKLWERRVAIVSTMAFIHAGILEHTFAIAELLLNDKEDLMHKATGWMLREAGKREKRNLVSFLELHAHEMPRTMLRYAIEKFSDEERKQWREFRG